jgi:hypothetical protein
VTDEPMDYRDWLIRQQQQDRIRQRFDALFTNDEEHAAAATQGIENLAYHEAQEAAAAYDHVQDSLTDVITQTRAVRPPSARRRCSIHAMPGPPNLAGCESGNRDGAETSERRS